jgi:glycerate kinase
MKLTIAPKTICLELSEDEAQRLYALIGATSGTEDGTQGMYDALGAELGEQKYTVIDEDGNVAFALDFKERE